jgi:hypothetical protein
MHIPDLNTILINNPMKKVLVITYSQTGQLDEIISNIIKQFDDDIVIHYEKLKPVPSFPFPWQGMSFYDAMPESVEMIPSKIEPLSVKQDKDYDLILLGYPIWFLSPPIPLTTFLKSEKAIQILSGKPVVTVIGARNMWVMAQEDIKRMIIDTGGQLKGNIALIDKHYNLISVTTIIYWMMTGKKERYMGFFPKPGVSDNDITRAERFGPAISLAVLNNEYDNLQSNLLVLNAVELSENIVSIERKGKRIFKIWARFILKKGGVGSKARVGRLKMFKRYLLFIIFAASPIASLVFYVTWPLFFMRIRKKMRYYSGVKLKMQIKNE